MRLVTGPLDLSDPFRSASSWADRIDAGIKALSSHPDRPYQYLGSCVGLDGDKITEMVASAKEITLKTMRRYCSTAEFEVALGYGRNEPGTLRLSKDWHVAYYKSEYDDRPCLYISHSAIEYVWVLNPSWEPEDNETAPDHDKIPEIIDGELSNDKTP